MLVIVVHRCDKFVCYYYNIYLFSRSRIMHFFVWKYKNKFIEMKIISVNKKNVIYSDFVTY